MPYMPCHGVSNAAEQEAESQEKAFPYHYFCVLHLAHKFTLDFQNYVTIEVSVLSTCPSHTNSGCGKERRILIGPW